MQLRTSIRRPGRYREDEVDELPPNPSFAIPTTPFNPNVRPACFPTLPLDQFPPDHPYHPSNSTGQSENDKPERPALVFRDQRIVPMAEEDELLGLAIGPDGRWISTLELGEYHGHHASNWDDDAPQERWFLPVSLNSSLYFSNSLLRNIRPSTGSCPGVTYRRA